MRNPRWPALAAALFLIAAARPAAARPVRYAGPHPVAASVAAAWCHIATPHAHTYAPDHGALYAQTAAGLLFAADPTPFGYRGASRVFVGNHPVPGDAGVTCYLDGPHRHAFAPAGDGYRVVSGAAFFVGDLGPAWPSERAVRGRAFARIYAPFESQRPVVGATPPPEWMGKPWSQPLAAPAAPAATAAPAAPPAPADGGAR